MDFGLAFSYVFQDRDWLRKVGIVALISLIPILGQLVLIGWSLNITKRVIERHPEPLPEVDFGGDLARQLPERFFFGQLFCNVLIWSYFIRATHF